MDGASYIGIHRAVRGHFRSQLAGVGFGQLEPFRMLDFINPGFKIDLCLGGRSRSIAGAGDKKRKNCQ